MFSVYVNGVLTGHLKQDGITSFVFSYTEQAKTPISLTMPIRKEPYVAPYLHPVFQVSLPEGDLRREIERNLSKRMDAYGDMAVLAVVGGHLIGRIQVLPEGAPLPKDQFPGDVSLLQSVLKHGVTDEMMSSFIQQHLAGSGVSGGYMKVLAKMVKKHESRITAGVDRWIVKYSDPDHPFLALNEYLSMKVAQRAGLPVPDLHLSEDAQRLVVKRFDVSQGGTRYGFEDMCALTGIQAGQKFTGSVEGIIKTIKHFAGPSHLSESLRQFFTQYVCATVIRNGDAHMKNFGMLYKEGRESAALSPCFDMVTMSAYAHVSKDGRVDDMMALTLEGTKRWPTPKMLEMLGKRCGLSSAEVARTIETVVESVKSVAADIPVMIEQYPEFRSVGEKMMAIWADGIASMGYDCDFSDKQVPAPIQ